MRDIFCTGNFLMPLTWAHGILIDTTIVRIATSFVVKPIVDLHCCNSFEVVYLFIYLFIFQTLGLHLISRTALPNPSSYFGVYCHLWSNVLVANGVKMSGSVCRRFQRLIGRLLVPIEASCRCYRHHSTKY